VATDPDLPDRLRISLRKDGKTWWWSFTAPVIDETIESGAKTRDEAEEVAARAASAFGYQPDDIDFATS
jgi:hypothetical protein